LASTWDVIAESVQTDNLDRLLAKPGQPAHRVMQDFRNVVDQDD
jgi:hypothetical protein